MVLGVVTTAKSKIYKRWKHIDNSITDSLNEAKDNVKYLATLDKYTEPLYHGDPQVRTPSPAFTTCPPPAGLLNLTSHSIPTQPPTLHPNLIKSQPLYPG